MDDDEHPILVAVSYQSVDAAAIGYLAAMLYWMTDCDPQHLARQWLRDIEKYTDPETKA